MDMKDFEKLFSEFHNLKTDIPKRRKTFMEVSGYPHYENVVSNILAFLFTDEEEHGLKNLWINSFLSVLGKSGTSNVEVKREYYTEEGNRIDLLVTTDDYIICIENKIYAGLANDLDDYQRTTYKVNDEDKPKHLIYTVLSLYEVEINNSSFKPVLYSELFDKVRENLGQYISECDNTWLTYMKDFMATIEALSGGICMDTEKFEGLYDKYLDEINEFEEQKREYLSFAISETRSVSDCVNKLINNDLKLCKCNNNSSYCYSSKDQFRASVVVDIPLADNQKNIIVVETSRDVWGWHISFYYRSTAARKFVENTLLVKTGYNVEPVKQEYEGHSIIKNMNNVSHEEVAEAIIEVIRTITPYVESQYNK